MGKRQFIVFLTCFAFAGTAYTSAQDVNNGKKIFNEYCRTCHQENGQGLGVVYPPLAKSDYISKTDKQTIIREVVFGKTGKVKVNGKDFNGMMMPLPPKYKDKDIADVITFVFTNFGNKKGKVTEKEVTAAKKKGKIK
ncbi:MAG: cytochrome c [Ignavibacteria bacterium]|nr:cytochrome c [Ignavibacteria bacterium]